jgi:hypothetical protein
MSGSGKALVTPVEKERAESSLRRGSGASGRWPALRACLIALHVMSMLVLSFPSSYRLADRRRWDDQRTQREFDLWSQRLTSLGIALSRDEIDRSLWRWAQRYLAVREALAWPFERYAQTTGTLQTWGMFRAPQRRPGKLRVELHEGDAWRVVYESRSSQHRYLGGVLDHNRVRKQVARTTSDEALFHDFARFIARRADRDFPAADGVRVTFLRFDSLGPEATRRGDPVVEVVERVVEHPFPAHDSAP